MVLAHKTFDAIDEAGNLLTNVEVRVQLEGGGLVSLYSDRAGATPIGNPVTFVDGKVDFYCAGGAYKITLTKGAYTRDLRYQAVGTAQERDATAFATPAQIRDELTANRTYYVRTDGSDNNDGLANTAGGAFLTIQKAVNTIADTLDIGSATVTVQVAAGTYATVTLRGLVGRGTVNIVGDETTPSNVVISSSGIAVLAVDFAGNWNLRGLKITSSANHGLFVRGAQVGFQNIDWGSVGSSHHHIGAYAGARINATGNSTISGGGGYHYYAELGGIILDEGRTITLSGTPAFAGQFAKATGAAVIGCGANTYSGSATGARYSADLNGVIRTYSAGASYLPGNSVGSTATGGQYG